MDAPGSLLAPCFNPQKASDNYLRLCHLITLLCGDLFRDILSRYIKPIYLRSKLDNNKQKLVNIFNKQQQNLIYPATGNTSLTTKDFDITILYILLRNICNIPSHNAGWGNPPAKGDNSIAAGIEKIRLTRNLILAHSTNGMIEDPVFERHWNDLRGVVVQIETQLTGSDLYKRGVDFLHSCNLTSVGTEADHNETKSKQDGVDTIYDKKSARFAEFFDEIAEGVPVEKIARLKDFIQNSCKAEDITSLKQAVSARDCLRYLRDAKLFTSSDVIFVQYLFKRINCNELFVECYRYAEKQDALCFYEKPPANGYQNVLFHVKGNLSEYSLERIAEIRETLAVLLNCTSKEILIGGACPSNSFLLVLFIKETYSCKLLALEQCDKDKLTKLNIDYIIIDLIVINLEPSKEFGWNIYFDPKYLNREDENMSFQEEKPTVSPSQHITTVFKVAEGLSDRENQTKIKSQFGSPQSVVAKKGDNEETTVHDQSSEEQSSEEQGKNEETTERGHSSEPESILSSKNLPLDQVNRRTLQSSEDNEDRTTHGQISDEQSIPSSQNLLPDQANRITLPSPEITTITVHFDRSDERYYVGEDVSIEAHLVNPPAVQCLAWIRKTENGNLSTCIDTTLPKYTQTGNETDKCFGLKINNCDESDAGTYLLLAVCTTVNISSNEISLQVVKEDQFIFISGPFMVSPSDDIDFRVYLPKESHGIPRWWKLKDQSIKEIEFDSNKYSYRNENRIHRMKITNATEEDSAEYQFSLGNKKSNKIYVYIDDYDKKQANCHRLIALLDVSAEALRITFDRQPGSFEEKINKIMKKCRKDKKNIESEELLSRLQMLQTNQTNSLKGVDIPQLYTMLRYLVKGPTNYPWGRVDVPKENDTEIPDDIERIRHYRNRFCHSDVSEMDTSMLNESVLDLLGAIRRLSSNDCKLIKDSCVRLNQAYTEVEYIAMKEKLKTFKKEQEKESKLLLNEDTGKLERIFRRSDVRFHDVCDSSISITKNYSTATQSELVTGGVCFMNRPMKFGEEVHIRGKYASLNLKGFKEDISLKIGLTEIDPDQIRSSINKKEASRSTIYSVNCVPEEDEGPLESFHLRLSLRDRNASRCRLETRLNEDQPEYFPDLKVPINGSLWLAIDLYRIKSIMISDN